VQTYLVSLLRTGETVPVRVFNNYGDAADYCRHNTPCNNGSYLLNTPAGRDIANAIELCCPEGVAAPVKGLGWTITGFFDGGRVGLHETLTGDEHEFPDWHVGEYEPPHES